jgi:multiple sugar transport system substrate-binding protein
MFNKIKKILYLLICIFVLAVFWGCSKQYDEGSGKTTLRFAYWDENQRATVDDYVKLFMKENPNIYVKAELVPWSQYWTKLDASAMAGDMPDVMWMNTDLPKYVRADLILPLDHYIMKDNINLSDYEKNMVSLYKFKGTQYAMPKGLDVVVVFYNKNIFDKYKVDYPDKGWKWDDLLKIGEKLKKRMKVSDGNFYPLVMELDPQPSYFNFIYQEDGYVFSKDGLSNGFGLPQDAEAFRKIIFLMKSGIMPSYTILSDTKGTDLFLSQRAAMLYMGTWQAANFEKSSFADRIGIIQMPKIKNNVTVMGGIGYCISNQSKHKEAAWKFVKFLSGFEANKIQAEKGTDIPALRSAQKYYIDYFKKINAKIFIEAAKDSVAYPTSPFFAKCNGIIEDYQSDIFSGRIPIATAMQEMSKEMDIIMNTKKK